MFDAVAIEAAGGNRERRMLATMYLKELGSDNSSRLALGGLLADLSSEHYSWAASGDAQNPDATTAQSRTDAFFTRLKMFFSTTPSSSPCPTHTQA